MQDKKKQAYQHIFNIFLILGVLTAIEYVVSQYSTSIMLLMLIALLKAVLIVNHFMHVYRLWREESH